MRKLIMLCAFIAASILPASAGAEKEGLYPAAPPPGSAYIRFINNTSKPELRGKSYTAPGAGKAGPYIPITAGAAEIVFNGKSATQKLAAGKFYSVIMAGDVLQVAEDPAFTDRMKTRIQLINLTARADVRLASADGQVEVVAPLKPYTSALRDVNAVTIGFAVFAGEQKLGETKAQPLERGASYAVILYEDAKGKPAIGYSKAAVE